MQNPEKNSLVLSVKSSAVIRVIIAQRKNYKA